MRMVRLLSLAGSVGVILLIASRGDFQPGIVMAMLLTLLIGLIEPSTAN